MTKNFAPKALRIAKQEIALIEGKNVPYERIWLTPSGIEGKTRVNFYPSKKAQDDPQAGWLQIETFEIDRDSLKEYHDHVANTY